MITSCYACHHTNETSAVCIHQFNNMFNVFSGSLMAGQACLCVTYSLMSLCYIQVEDDDNKRVKSYVE